MRTLMIFYVLAGFVSVLLSVPLLVGKVKPNPLYGFRVRATLDDPVVWYALNRFFAARLLAVGLCVIFAALIMYIIPGIGVDAYALSVLAVLVVAMTFAMAQCIRYLRSLKR